MNDILQNPAVQAGVLPFAAALVVAALLRNTRQLGLAIAAGFLCAVALTMGFGFESLTSLKKLVLVGIAAAALGAMLETPGAGAALLVQMLSSAGAPVGWSLGFSAQVIAGLVALLAVALAWFTAGDRAA